jgi:hypothetical protein
MILNEVVCSHAGKRKACSKPCEHLEPHHPIRECDQVYDKCWDGDGNYHYQEVICEKVG